jgi:hypothetical protein
MEFPMSFSQPVSSLIRQRYSCRKYQNNSISPMAYPDLVDFINTLPAGPFNAPNRFILVTANGQDNNPLRGLGTYGTIKSPTGFIIGAAKSAEKDMEDFGYRMEMIILKGTDLGMGTCWLVGFFTRSSFSKMIGIEKGETLPAICSLGIPEFEKTNEQIYQSRSRFPWDVLFFSENFNTSFNPEMAGKYSQPLEMVRLAPSAQNRQPWRIVNQGDNWHFYLQRTKGYREMVLPGLTGISDLQRIDMGICMAHFESSAREDGLKGQWQMNNPGIQLTNKLMEYTVSWIASSEKE